MITKCQTLRRLGGAVSILLLAVGCREITPTGPANRSFARAFSRSIGSSAARHVFVLNGNVPSDFASRVAAHNGTVVSSMDAVGVVVTEGLTDDDAKTLAGSNSVASDYAGQWIPEPYASAISADSMLASADVTAASSSPLSAPLLQYQWNMFQIHAPEAWATGRTGSRTVRVAILDTGLDPDHVELRGLIDVAHSVAFVPSVTGPTPWTDDESHGTSVASIVTSNNYMIAGVAPNVSLMAVKVLDNTGAGSIGAILSGIYYATNAGAQVINMSLGFELPKTVHGAGTLLAAFNRVVNYATSHGTLIVSAAGNDAQDLQHGHDFVSLPCEAGVQLCVSATTRSQTLASYSNFGTNAIDVAAPGGDLPLSLSTLIIGACSSHSTVPNLAGCRTNTRQYLLGDGTSFSTPHVSGLAAYLDSQYPTPLTPSQLISTIEQRADDIGKPGADPYFGKGRINVVNTITTANP